MVLKLSLSQLTITLEQVASRFAVLYTQHLDLITSPLVKSIHI